ncbi:hypothetical protein TVVG_00005 [Tetraselmis viridis virus SI1]|uniref:hypothetical protein n=1 Tax=Tetraselmis viridis virus S20 TaxID=754070 RepID=UPI0002C054EC|nr:hypothetical protein TVGG_00026 [Tetraselmis viridis virus S20]AGH31354.1 hypothetical protein TVGG_00026 [Tetraselmis viridis virus S20]AGH31388.1 hypothetical protein TVVG_00005 [Tetraselmis viridis virus SI1]
MFRDFLKDLATGSLTWNVALVLAAIGLLFLGGFTLSIGAGVLVKVGTALAGIIVLMLALRLVTLIRGLSGRNDAGLDIIKGDPRALAILRGAYIIGAGLIIAHVFG